MMDFIREYKRYFITAVIGLVIVIAICFSRNVFAVENTGALFTVLSDAFLVPGMIFLGLGIIFYATNEGLFNAISYGMKIIGRTLAPPKGEKIINEEFHEYHARMSKKKIKFRHFILVGAIYLAIAVLFTILYIV